MSKSGLTSGWPFHYNGTHMLHSSYPHWLGFICFWLNILSTAPRVGPLFFPNMILSKSQHGTEPGFSVTSSAIHMAPYSVIWSCGIQWDTQHGELLSVHVTWPYEIKWCYMYGTRFYSLTLHACHKNNFTI